MKISQINAIQIVKVTLSDEYDNEYQIHGGTVKKIIEILKTHNDVKDVNVIFKRCAGILDD